MNTMYASRADGAFPAAASDAPAPAAGAVRVWDAPVRVVHWLAVLCFAGAWLTAERESWRLLHVTLGLTFAGLVAFRVLWGFVGTRHARFASFVRGPQAVRRHVAQMLRGTPEPSVGHNPLGAWAIVALLTLGALVTATGWATYDGLTAFDLEEVHEALANAMLLLVGVHIAGVLVSGRLHGESLVRAMVTGVKRGAPADAIRRPWRGVAALVLASVLGFWAWQATTAPARDTRAAATLDAAGGAPAAAQDDDDDDD